MSWLNISWRTSFLVLYIWCFVFLLDITSLLIPQIREFSSGVLEFLHILSVGLDLIISFASGPLSLPFPSRPDILSLTWHNLQVTLSCSFSFVVLNFLFHVLIHFGFTLETYLIIKTCFHILNYVQYFIQPFVFSLYSLWSQPSFVSLFCQRCSLVKWVSIILWFGFMGIKVHVTPVTLFPRHFPSRGGGRRSHVVRGDLSYVRNC